MSKIWKHMNKKWENSLDKFLVNKIIWKKQIILHLSQYKINCCRISIIKVKNKSQISIKHNLDSVWDSNQKFLQGIIYRLYDNIYYIIYYYLYMKRKIKYFHIFLVPNSEKTSYFAPGILTFYFSINPFLNALLNDPLNEFLNWERIDDLPNYCPLVLSKFIILYHTWSWPNSI
jgi:hypothetical protein